VFADEHFRSLGHRFDVQLMPAMPRQIGEEHRPVSALQMKY
jgi:hypothetical protein